MYRRRRERDPVQATETYFLAGTTSEARARSEDDFHSRKRRLQDECRGAAFWYRVCCGEMRLRLSGVLPGNRQSHHFGREALGLPARHANFHTSSLCVRATHHWIKLVTVAQQLCAIR
jgi:hypothetical protein